MLFCLQFFFLLRIFTYSYSLQLERLHLSYFMECKLHDLDKEQFLDVIDNICKGRILNLSKGTCNLFIKFKLQLFLQRQLLHMSNTSPLVSSSALLLPNS